MLGFEALPELFPGLELPDFESGTAISDSGAKAITGPTCRKGDCREPATYGYVYNEPLFCFQHHEKRTVDLETMRCRHDRCIRLPATIAGDPHFCGKHSKLLLDAGKLCDAPGCKNMQYRRSKCRSHYRDLKDKSQHCTSAGCVRIALIGTTRCVIHPKLSCTEPDCKEDAVYGPEERNFVHCIIHREKEDTFRKPRKLCTGSPSCRKATKYGYWTDTVPSRCETHAEAGHQDLTQRCEIPGCFECSSYGFRKSNVSRCHKHVMPDMRKFTKKRRIDQID